MSRDGSGNYSLPAGNPVSTGTTISSTWANNTLSDIASALTQSVSRDGQTTYTGNQPMGGNRFLNVGNAAARNEFATLGQVQDSGATYLTSVAGTNTITASLTGLTSYVTGLNVRFIPVNSVTGATTLNINGIGAIPVTKQGSTALVSGDIVSGQVCEVLYDGSQFQLVSVPRTMTYTGLTVTGTATFASGSWTSTGASWSLSSSGNPTIDYTNSTSDAASGKVRFFKSRSSATTNSGDSLGLFQFFGKDTSNVDRLGGYMQFAQGGLAGSTFIPGQCVVNLTDTSGGDIRVLSATAAAVNVPVPLQENATRVFSRNAAFVSSEQTVSNNTVTPVGHGFTGIPTLATLSLRCKTADIGYSVNEEVDLTFYTNAGGTVQLSRDATNCYIVHNNSINLVNKGSPGTISTITNSSWRWVVRAWF